MSKSTVTAADPIVRSVRDLRSLPVLWPLRGRRHAVLVCRDDADEYEEARARFAALRAELLVEPEAGPLSTVLGRPAVAVVDRYGTVALREERPPVARVLAELEGFELACPECGPQAWGDPGI
jgi:hypothetical protein